MKNNSKFKTSCSYTQDFRKEACKYSHLPMRTEDHQVQFYEKEP